MSKWMNEWMSRWVSEQMNEIIWCPSAMGSFDPDCGSLYWGAKVVLSRTHSTFNGLQRRASTAPLIWAGTPHLRNEAACTPPRGRHIPRRWAVNYIDTSFLLRVLARSWKRQRSHSGLGRHYHRVAYLWLVSEHPLIFLETHFPYKCLHLSRRSCGAHPSPAHHRQSHSRLTSLKARLTRESKLMSGQRGAHIHVRMCAYVCVLPMCALLETRCPPWWHSTLLFELGCLPEPAVS